MARAPAGSQGSVSRNRGGPEWNRAQEEPGDTTPAPQVAVGHVPLPLPGLFWGQATGLLTLAGEHGSRCKPPTNRRSHQNSCLTGLSYPHLTPQGTQVSSPQS